MDDSTFNIISISTEHCFSQKNIEKLIDSINDGTVFNRIIKISDKIINEYSKTKTCEIILLNNTINEDDEELKLVPFTSYVNENKLICKYCKDDIEDEEEYDRIHFDLFEIEINSDTISFEMKYNKKLHPKYVGTVIRNSFRELFDDLIVKIDEF